MAEDEPVVAPDQLREGHPKLWRGLAIATIVSLLLMVALVATIFIAAVAEPEHRRRPVGVLGLTIFLLALCWWVFIKQLDIRVAVWPQI